MRVLYSALFYLILPFILLRLYWRGHKAPLYRQRWLERLGFYRCELGSGNLVWFHAVSVGESEALFPLIKHIQHNRPDLSLLVTTTTPTGSERVKAVLGETVLHVYLPYDMPDTVARFMQHFKPKMAVIMETEIWPNLFAACKQRTIPLYLVNARLSGKSARGYQKLGRLSQEAVRNITTIAAQSKQDAERYMRIGALSDQVHVTGNIKFDISIEPSLLKSGKDLKTGLLQGRKVWIAASTHKGEDEIFLKVYQQLKTRFPALLLMLVPRHPERFNDVKKLSEQAGLQTVMRTQAQQISADTDVYIADTMGELKMLYASADIAFVAGSLIPVGGHNVLEAAALGLPVIFGPNMFNFREIAQGLLNEKAAKQCRDAEELENMMHELLTKPDLAKAMGARAKSFVLNNKGALEKTYHLLSQKFPGA